MASAGPLTIAVLIKQVPDMNAIRIDRATGRIVPSPQLVMSSYDEYAVEAALRLKESFGGEVIAVAAGPAQVRDVITRALAMGADRGVHLEMEDVNATDTLGMASILSDALRPLGCSLVIAGQTSDDLEAGQVGAQVAELLKMPVISNVVEITDRRGRAAGPPRHGRRVSDCPLDLAGCPALVDRSRPAQVAFVEGDHGREKEAGRERRRQRSDRSVASPGKRRRCRRKRFPARS